MYIIFKGSGASIARAIASEMNVALMACAQRSAAQLRRTNRSGRRSRCFQLSKKARSCGRAAASTAAACWAGAVWYDSRQSNRIGAYVTASIAAVYLRQHILGRFDMAFQSHRRVLARHTTAFHSRQHLFDSHTDGVPIAPALPRSPHEQYPNGAGAYSIAPRRRHNHTGA
jgi:hypothetical protein